MPTYEYKCERCGYTFEKFQKMIFKGSDFHATNYAKSNSPACGRDRPCCGRDLPCDKKPCE